MLCLNVCGLVSKFRTPEFEELISEYDCLVFVESKTDSADDSIIETFFNGHDFNVYSKHRRRLSTRKSGGIIVCIKKHLLKHVKLCNTTS